MQEQKIWHAGVLGMTLNVDEGRITIFRSTLETLGWPSHYRFLYNPQMNQIAVQVCSAADAGAHRVGKLNEFSSCELGNACISQLTAAYNTYYHNAKEMIAMITATLILLLIIILCIFSFVLYSCVKVSAMAERKLEERENEDKIEK